MPLLPILAPTVPGSENPAQPQGSQVIHDGVLDSFGALHRRRGLRPASKLPTKAAITGIFYWQQKDTIIVTAGTQVWAMGYVGTDYFEITPIGPVALNPETPVSFAADASYLFFCNGRNMITWDGILSHPAIIDTRPSVPEKPEFVVYFKDYILANIGGTRKYVHAIRGITEPETNLPTWNPILHQAVSSPSTIKAMVQSWEEMFILTFDTGQFHYASGQEADLFPPLEGSYVNRGVAAPHSLVMVGNTWMWLTNDRLVVQLNGRSPQTVSASIQTHLDRISNVSSAFAFSLLNFYVITFPDADVTWAYDIRTKQWFQWGDWDPENHRYHQWMGRHSVILPNSRRILVGGYDGMLFWWDNDYVQDNLAPIRLLLDSAHLDHGSPGTHKEANELVIRMKRGL